MGKKLKRIPELPKGKIQFRTCVYTKEDMMRDYKRKYGKNYDPKEAFLEAIKKAPIVGKVDPGMLKKAPIVGKINLKKK